ncbi:hypothetical protein BASA83_013200 [Batrachochytrium salamandrivorans]|nr:hypothetical protein BASA83_013200 [Batrachochytrium salamandrivorans]
MLDQGPSGSHAKTKRLSTKIPQIITLRTYWIMTPQGLRLPKRCKSSRSCTMVSSSNRQCRLFLRWDESKLSLDS